MNEIFENNDCKVKIIPLGGLEQIGMNMTAIEYDDTIIVMDCGLAFPSDDMLGIDLVIPDVTYLMDNIDKVKGFVITHKCVVCGSERNNKMQSDDDTSLLIKLTNPYFAEEYK